MPREKKLKNPRLLSIDIVLSETRASVDNQTAVISSLDTRLGALLGLSGVILAASLSYPAIRCDNSVTKWLFVTSVFFVMISLLSATIGYFRKFKGSTDPLALREFYLTQEQEKTKLAIIDYLGSVYEWNQQKIAEKAKYTRISFAVLLIGSIIMGLIIILDKL